ncbi:tyrosine-type recombinase/integrase [Microvirga sp. BT350]|uniref:Tyrosine-type recombinase/integrase n=2 Tax=Microvirga alba TaxID=2791025 RepID=A0A931BW91_9HYPH|nr:tyrosine-type recombinase/integrase [Microvirga alba]
MSWGEARDRYWEEVGKHHAGEGAENTRRALDWLDNEIGRDAPVQDIGNGKVAEIVATRRGQGVANATVNRSATEPLRKVLNRARDIWSQTVQPIRWKDHMLAEPVERVRELTQKEEQSLLENIRPDYLSIFLFSLASGVRLGGCIALRWKDVDWGEREVHIRGKGGVNYKIPLSLTMREILWPLQGQHTESVFTYVVQRTRGKRVRGTSLPITAAGLKTEWRRAREAAGLPSTGEDWERGYRWHDNRHTRATRLLRQNGNLKMVQRLLGHRKIETTVKYAHVTMDDLRQALDDESRTNPQSAEVKTA